MDKILRPVWNLLGAAPIWLKIMGIVVFPQLFFISLLILYIRSRIFELLVGQTHRAILASIYPVLTQQSVLLLITTALVGILLSYGLSLILVRPVRQLLSAIQSVEKGDLSVRVDQWAQDEIGQLQSAFNTMTGRLESTQNALLDHNRELAAVNEIAESVANEQSLEAVISATMSRVMALVGADAGVFYLLENDQVTLSLKALKGFSSADSAKIFSDATVPKVLFKSAIETGRVYAYKLDQLSSEISSEVFQVLAKEGITVWAAVPIKRKDQLTGVFGLGKCGPQRFEDSNLLLLEVVGNIVGGSLTTVQLFEDLRCKEAELRRALRRAVEVQEDERRRLSRELHDEAGQALTSILIRLKALQEEKDYQTVIDRLDGLRYLTYQTLEELRRMAMDLRPAALDNLGIVPALRWYTEECAERTGLEIQFTGPEKLERLPSETEVVLYRVAQEGLTNAVRHGKARKVEVNLQRGPRAIWLAISDDGQGFNVSGMDRGLGLVGIQERVELLDGTCGIDTAPGAGTRLWVELPLKES